MRFLCIIFISVLFSCKHEGKTDIVSFQQGEFKSYVGIKKDSSLFYRNAKYQIENYQNQIDSFYITWNTPFEYQLQKIHPKDKLDSLPFIVKITAIKPNSYEFKASYLGSRFVQKGVTYKIK